MLPTDTDVVALCAAIYNYADGPAVAWDHFDQGDDDGVCWGLKRLAGADVIVYRGSTTFEDWVRDLDAAPILTPIGHVHDGFHAGMQRASAEARALLKQPAIVSGHSLGAARAAIATAYLTRYGVPPVARVVFGEPKPGFADLAQAIVASPGRSYRNGDGTHHDLITDVPFSFPPLDYVHPTPIIPVCAPPAADDRWGAFSWHHIQLYEAALAPRRVPVSV
jgi:hypothetical protein